MTTKDTDQAVPMSADELAALADCVKILLDDIHKRAAQQLDQPADADRIGDSGSGERLIQQKGVTP
jgi:hypothetical protein